MKRLQNQYLFTASAIALAFLLLPSCAKNSGPGAAPIVAPPSAPVPAKVETANDLISCTAAEMSDYDLSAKTCQLAATSDDSNANPRDNKAIAACQKSVQNLFTKYPSINCFGSNTSGRLIELEAASQFSKAAADLTAAPLPASSTSGICGTEVQNDYKSIVEAGCPEIADSDANSATNCQSAIKTFLARYPDVDCHPEAARDGEPLRAWRLKALTIDLPQQPRI